MERRIRMRLKFSLRPTTWIVAGVLSTATLGACTHPRYYDNVSNVNRTWNAREERAYRRWEAERNMRDIRFERRAAAEQRAYWEWRRDHPDAVR
jgi:hypothetical protein